MKLIYLGCVPGFMRMAEQRFGHRVVHTNGRGSIDRLDIELPGATYELIRVGPAMIESALRGLSGPASLEHCEVCVEFNVVRESHLQRAAEQVAIINLTSPSDEPSNEREPWCAGGPLTKDERELVRDIERLAGRMEWWAAVELGPQCARDQNVMHELLWRVGNLVRRNAHRRRIATAERIELP